MRRTFLALGLACAVAAVGAVPAFAVCDVPLLLRQAGSGANVLIILDNSSSMNEVVYADAYDENTTYAGGLTSTTTYTVATSGTYSPRSFKSTLAATPTAYLVASDQGEAGQYSGNYLNWVFSVATATQRAAIPTVTRIQVAKQVVNGVLAGAGSGRYGVMVFNGDNGGTLISPIGTAIATMQGQVNGIRANAYTPLAETMVTALTYFQTTGAGAPIQAACQQTFVVIVSDGHPTKDLNVPGYLQDYDGDGQDPGTCASLGAPYPNTMDCSGYLDDVATYMFRNDMRPDLAGTQNVTTYVVGFNIFAPILQATATKGGGTFYNAANAAQLTIALNDALADIEAKVSAGGSVSVVSAEDRSSNRLFRAKYESETWRGFVEAYALPYRAGDLPLWQAGPQLQSRDASTRTIFTSTTGTNQVALTSANAASLVTPLAAADVTEATNIIEYARGNPVTGTRDRSGWKLGDIVDAAPVAVGKPSGFNTFLNYSAFRAARASRADALYVGANDGMLHCFDAATGAESWAYVPKNQLGKLRDLMAPDYCHEYFVNLTPTVSDVYVNGAWKTVLFGGQERGGSGLFALDVTDPAPGQVSVMWDVDLPQLKGAWNRPALVRDRNRDAYVLAIGTGYDAASAQANLLVLDPANGSVLSTLALGSPAAGNMTTRATVVDRDFDGYDDVLYLGDLTGRLWRVDLTTNPWSVSLLFNCGQPIQAPPVLTMDELGRVMVFFGTGRYLTDADLTTTATQTFYGVVDDGSGGTVALASLVDQTSSISAVTSGQRGWYVNLTQYAGERITRGAVLIAGTLYVPSFRPKSGACQQGGESWLNSFDYNDGSAPDRSNGTENNTTAGRVESMGDGVLAEASVDLVNESLVLQSSNASLLTHGINTGLRRLMVRSWRQKWN